MTWAIVARKDFSDAVQSRALWALVTVFALTSVVSTYGYVEVPEMFGSPGGATFDGLILFTVGFTGLFVPLAAIVVCYKALAGERELGSIKILLSLPTNRRDVFVGKVIGRAAVLGFGLGIGLLVGLGLGGILLGTVELVPLLVFLVLTLVFAGIYACIVVSLSATTGSTSRAITLTLGFFVVFELFWDVIPLGILYVVEGFQLPTTMPNWMYPVMQLSPSAAYFSALIALLPDIPAAVGGQQSPMQVGGGAGAEPFYTQPEIGIVILLFWLIFPLVVGYRQFEAADM